MQEHREPSLVYSVHLEGIFRAGIGDVFIVLIGKTVIMGMHERSQMKIGSPN